jgi:hypothetical protein
MESRPTITRSAVEAFGRGSAAAASRFGERRPWVSLILLGAIFVVALLVRLPGMDHRLLPDEGYTWLVGSAPDARAFLHRLAVYENTPPLYYLLLTPLPLGDEPWIRLPSMLAGLAMLPVLFSAVRPALGVRVALLASLALAIALCGCRGELRPGVPAGGSGSAVGALGLGSAG